MMASAQTRHKVAIFLERLPGIDETPGLIVSRMDLSKGSKPPRKIGVLTDAALRGRLAHFDAHSANELAAVRQALRSDRGQVVVYETWPQVSTCLRFWHGFAGSRIQPIGWNCEKCGSTESESIGGSAGESFLCRCKCGQVQRLTVPK